MKKQTLKAIIIVFIGLLVWIGMNYIAIAFIKAEPNPFVWSQGWRSAMVFVSSMYLIWGPLSVNELKDKL